MLRAINRPDLSAARRIREALGEVLRETRRHRGLTLREVAALAGSRFKPSAIGGYERGERSISLERFCDLAELYGVPADRLLSQVLARVMPEGRVEVVVDLTRLELLPGEEPRIAAELIDRVRRQRGDLASAQITLRAGDLEALALAAKLAPGDLLRRLEPALQFSGAQARSDA
jgi:transcriptional regulator with XRE-family HTH domain